MLELGSSGSVRGVSSNGHPYRDPRSKAVIRWPNPDHAVTPLFTLPARADLGWSSSFADPCE